MPSKCHLTASKLHLGTGKRWTLNSMVQEDHTHQRWIYRLCMFLWWIKSIGMRIVLKMLNIVESQDCIANVHAGCGNRTLCYFASAFYQSNWICLTNFINRQSTINIVIINMKTDITILNWNEQFWDIRVVNIL